ncbi:MAG: dephospho-CoA kinase [Hydrogenophilales bacterium]|nr:dephospho-CoA kinase [Hydrogenophilales bacterium]
MMVFSIGLTGGIGCGKSTVAHLFAELGAATIDTDAFSHALTQPGAAGFKAIIHRFGPRYLQADGTLDRGKLRELIFSDAAAKQALESILHPLIHAEVLAAIHACQAPYAVIVVPLLFETGNYLPLIQRSLVVDCAEACQIARATARSGLPETAVRAIMAHQLPRAVRLERADDIISNENGLDSLRAQVETCHAQYLSLARQASAKS